MIVRTQLQIACRIEFHALTLGYNRVCRHFKQLSVILVIVTPSDGSVIDGQQVLIVFMRGVSTNGIKQVMEALYWGHIYPQRYGNGVDWFVSKSFTVEFNVCLPSTDLYAISTASFGSFDETHIMEKSWETRLNDEEDQTRENQQTKMNNRISL